MRRWYQTNKNQSLYIAEHATTLSNLSKCERLMNTEKNDEVFIDALKHNEEAL